MRRYSLVLSFLVMGGVVHAQQPSIPAGQRAGARAGRGQNALEKPLVDQPQPARPKANQPAKANDVPKLTPQQANAANVIERRYLLNLHQVGLSPEQAEKVGASIQRFLRMTLRLSLQRTDLNEQMQKLTSEPKGSDEELQGLMQQLDTNQTSLRRVNDNFYKEVTPVLSPEQQAKLRIYMQQTNQQIHQAIEESRQAPAK